MSNFEPLSIPKTEKNVEALTNWILENQYPPCYICNEKPIITMCIKCEQPTCKNHCINPNESGKLMCMKCKVVTQ